MIHDHASCSPWSRHVLIIIALLALCGCHDGSDVQVLRRHRASDTLYTEARAMALYAYQPERALHIIDSAAVVGNIADYIAELNRARIYSMTQMGGVMDSLLHGGNGVRFDSARAVCERMLLHDSVQANLELHQDVLEILIYAARQQQDTTRWLLRARELVEVCHSQGAEVEALRTEAEIGAALCHLGQRQEGMARLDSVLAVLAPAGGLGCRGDTLCFNALDAAVIAMKRKIGVLQTEAGNDDLLARNSTAIISLARRIIEYLTDYERNPEAYHDGSYREPRNATSRADYILFYRSQAQNIITATYKSLSEHCNVTEAFEEVERGVREAAEREHTARYRALEHQMLCSQAESRTHIMTIVALACVMVVVLLLHFATYTHLQKKKMQEKNRALVRQIDEAMRYKEKYESVVAAQEADVVEQGEGVAASQADSGGAEAEPAPLSSLSDAQLFTFLSDLIVRRQLYKDPKFCRQTLLKEVQVSKDRIGNAFSRGSGYTSLTAFVRDLRLEHAFRLLSDDPSLPIEQVAMDSGFTVTDTFTRNFKSKYGLTPSEFRQTREQSREAGMRT